MYILYIFLDNFYFCIYNNKKLIMQIIESIFSLFNSLLNHTKKLNLSKLPSQGKFYKDDFEIKIKRSDLEDIIDYEYNFDKENVFLIVESIKKVVRKNIILPAPFLFDDIKSVDLVFLFLEIVKFTKKRGIKVPYFNTKIGKEDLIEFNSENFNYFDFSKYEFDNQTKEILIDGYRFSMSSIGIENNLTLFLAKKIKEGKNWSDYVYDFLFFSNNKNYLSEEELENLVLIFNFDMEDSEKKSIQKIVNNFMKIVGYSLKIDGEVVELKTKINLETIWK